MVTACVVYGLGIGCHEEVKHAFIEAGAHAELTHMNQLLAGKVDFSQAQILDIPGGFLQGDILGAGMCAANELEHAEISEEGKTERVKELLLEFVDKGNVIYAQCNGFQLLVKAGILPGINGDYSKQTVTLTYNDCGVYRVSQALHKIERPHFAFKDVDDSDLYLWCRHGEGKIRFFSGSGMISREKAEQNRKKTNSSHVLLRYANPATHEPTEEFPHNPNGSVDGIAGLVNCDGRIFGHMAHTEVGVYSSRDSRWFYMKDQLRRQGIKAKGLEGKMLEDVGLKIFKNIVDYFK